VLAALGMVLQLQGHDDDVLDGVVESAHGVRRDGGNPPRRNRGRELRDAIDVEAPQVEQLMANGAVREVVSGRRVDDVAAVLDDDCQIALTEWTAPVEP
jgi:hypothetical protein